MEPTVKLMMRLIRGEICRDTDSSDLPTSLTAEQLQKLYVLSKAHDVCHIVGTALRKASLLDDDSSLSKNFGSQIFAAAYRYENLNYELSSVCDRLEKAHMQFIVLKGSVLRAHYPEPWFRTSCDIDVLVHREDLDRAIELFVADGYTRGGEGAHDVSLFSPGGIHLELHYDLVEDGRANASYAVLKKVWNDATVKDGCSYQMQMTDAMFYFYHVAHMAKHFVIGGCGIRPFIDMWILTHVMDADEQARAELIRKGGLQTFERAVRHLCEVWFSSAEEDELSRQMQVFLLRGGVYGNKENLVSVQSVKEGGRIRYALSRIFLSYDQIKYQYPILQKHRYLTPFCEVARWFRLLFCGRAGASVRELNMNGGVSKEKSNATTDFLNKIGL